MTTGVLPWEEFLGKMNLNTGFFETSQLTLDAQMRVIAGNWDGAGMSAGNLQYNWGTADRLSELFGHMFTNYESVVQGAFGADTTRFNEFKTVNTTYTRTQKITWGGTITDPNNGHKIIEPWLTYIGNLMVTPECYAKYIDMMDMYYLQNALFLFRQLSCTSRLALASLFDVSVNKGRYYPINLIQVDFEELDANVALTEAEREAQKIYQINFRGNEEENALNDASSTTFWPRRSAMANMGGDYFGSLYDPENQFDMNLEPAIAEKSDAPVNTLNVKLGDLQINDLFLGDQKISSLYLGANLLSNNVPTEPFTTTEVPQTQFRTNPNSYAGIGAVSSITLDYQQPLWCDVQNYVACKTHFTIDGSTPTTASPALGNGPFEFVTSCTLKTLTVSTNGIAEPVKTLTVTVTGSGAGVTTISPTSTTQNTIPFTVTLSNSLGDTIYYKVGAGTQQTYTGPFSVSQSTNDVGVNILVTYWSTGETEKTITYNTSGAIPVKATVTATPGNWYVRLDWAPTANTTSYNIYRSTVSGQLGEMLAQYQAGTGFDDNTPQNGTTYYYTVRSANYQTFVDSTPVTATPGAPVAPTYRYVRYVGYGDQTGTTSRLVELQALEGATNRLLNKPPMAGYAVPNGGTIAVATDGVKLQSSGYPLWWTGAGVPDLHYDMGALYPIDMINVTGYSPTTDPRQTKFKIYVSKDNTNWTLVQDYSLNTTVQPVDGFYFTVT
jgi:hypothetical protein